MAKIALADAVHLRSTIQNKIRELSTARSQVEVVTFEKGEIPEPVAHTVESYTAQIMEAQRDFRLLDVLMAQNNLQYTVPWDGEEITLMEALQTAKDTRQLIAGLKQLGNRPKTSRGTSSRYGADRSMMTEQTTYDPEAMKQQAEKLERQVLKLSRAIDRKNEEVTFDFWPAHRYMVVDDDEE